MAMLRTPLVAGTTCEVFSCYAKRQPLNHRWSWLLLSTRRPAWCAPWMLHQGSEPALERAASQRLSAQGERFRRCISMQSQGHARSNFHMAQHFVRLHKEASEAWKAQAVMVELHCPELCYVSWSTSDWQSSGLSLVGPGHSGAEGR